MSVFGMRIPVPGMSSGIDEETLRGAATAATPASIICCFFLVASLPASSEATGETPSPSGASSALRLRENMSLNAIGLLPAA